MIRLATGDLSAIMPGASPCGRTNTRIAAGWAAPIRPRRSRACSFTRASGGGGARRHPELGRLRLVVTRADEQDVMTLMAEAAGLPEGRRAAVAATLLSLTKLRGDVQFVVRGALPNDGKVISDERQT